MLTLIKVGGDVVIDSGSGPKRYYPLSCTPRRALYYADNTVSIHIGDFKTSAAVALAGLTIAGVTPANESQFKTQWALVFP